MTPKGGSWIEKDKPAVLAISTEPFLLGEAERHWKDHLIPPEGRDLNFMALYGWEAKLSEVLEFVQTMPFLGDRRLLVVREVQKFEEWQGLVEYLKDPNPASRLLLTSSELKRSGAQFKALSANCEVAEMRRPAGKGLIRWVSDRFAMAGKTIDSELVEILVQTAGEDLGILVAEIEKVVLSSGDDPVIKHEDLSVSVPGGVEIVFSLLDALGDNNTPKAVSSLQKLLMNDNAPEYLIHMMAWHYRQLLKGKELVNSGLSPGEAAVRMGKKYSSHKEKFARHLGRANEESLARALEVLSDCDRELKRGRVPNGVLMDRLVLELLV